MKKPLTPLELALYARCLRNIVEDEFTPRAERALVTGSPNAPGE